MSYVFDKHPSYQLDENIYHHLYQIQNFGFTLVCKIDQYEKQFNGKFKNLNKLLFLKKFLIDNPEKQHQKQFFLDSYARELDLLSYINQSIEDKQHFILLDPVYEVNRSYFKDNCVFIFEYFHGYTPSTWMNNSLVDPSYDLNSIEDRASTYFKELIAIDDFIDFYTNHFYKIFTSLLKAIQTLHQHNIVHLDIKSDNIMYQFETGILKVIDFNVSHRFTPETPHIMRCLKQSRIDIFHKHYPENMAFCLSTSSEENIAKIFDIYTLTATMVQLFYWYYCYINYMKGEPEYDGIYNKDIGKMFHDRSYDKMFGWDLLNFEETLRGNFTYSDPAVNFISQGRQLSFSELFLPNTTSNNPQPFDLNQLDGDQNVSKEKLELIFDFMVKMFDDMFNNLPSVEEMTQDKQWSVKYLESFLKRLDHTRNEIS